MSDDDVSMSGARRATRPADQWEITGFDPADPEGSTLVLIASDGTALTMPFDPDLLAACTTVARAWDSDYHDEDEEGEDEDPEDEDGPLGGMSRLTGWHQVSAFWDNLPDDRRKRITLAVLAVLLLLAIATRLV